MANLASMTMLKMDGPMTRHATALAWIIHGAP